MALLLPQQTGYCQPVFAELENLFGARSGIMQAQTGTLDALLSQANTPRSAGGGAAVDIELFSRGTGKRNEYRLYFEKRSSCPTDLGDCQTLADIDFCEDATANTNNYIEYVLNPDDICYNKVGDWKYDYANGELVCPESLASVMAKEMAEKIENYKIALNNKLWGQLTAPYAPTDTTVDPCVASESFGVGKGGWMDINGNYFDASTNPSFQIMNSVGAVFPFFAENWGNLLESNGFRSNPIVVHGRGSLASYVRMLGDGAFQCCNDAGVNQAALAQSIGMFNFLEGRPRANHNTGVSQETTLVWEPGAHIMIQPYILGQELQEIKNEAHERYQFVDSMSGLQFLLIRNREYCNGKVEDRYQLWHGYKLISRPLDLAECLGSGVAAGEGINQTLCVDFTRCSPVDCDGVPSWGPAGDPTAVLDTYTP